MPILEIKLEDTFPAFEPGMLIRGSAAWQAFPGTGVLEVNLLWHTEGKGDRDAGIAASHTYEVTQRQGDVAFQFTAPAFPYSFSGRLISLLWKVEGVLGNGKESSALSLFSGSLDSAVAQVPLLIAPGGKEIELRSVDG